jgi:hypothetical protein
MQVEHLGGVKSMSDEQIERGIELIKGMLAEREAGANAKVIDGVPEPVPALPPPSRKARRKVRRSDRADSGLAARVVGTDSADGDSCKSTSAPRILSADVADAIEALVGPPERRSAKSQVKGEAHFGRREYARPQGALSRHHRGLALASQAFRGLRLGSLRHCMN